MIPPCRFGLLAAVCCLLAGWCPVCAANGINEQSEAAEGSPAQIVSFVDVAHESFRSHPLHALLRSEETSSHGLIEYMQHMAASEACRDKPIFTSMARVQSPLYWQLIEGFFHAMFLYDHLSCAVMICVTDPQCVAMCEASGYPCFDFRHPDPATHVMEQVADLKLQYVGRALEAGVSVLLLDLDVGFMRDPWLLCDGFLANPLESVRAQMDVGSCMNKSAGMTWFTQPLTNFGVFLVKADELSVKAFRQANKQYKRVPPHKRITVATDQNVVAGALKWARWRFGYNFSYFSIGFDLSTKPRPVLPQKVLLLHHMNLMPSVHGRRFQLGGAVAGAEVGDAIGVHATCYEKSTKLYGLKATNAYWNFKHYDPSRRTITKPLMVLSRRQVRLELELLSHLAVQTGRSLIIPNLLVGVGKGIPGQLPGGSLSCRENPLLKSAYCLETGDYRNAMQDENNAAFAPWHNGEYYWPAFRTFDESEPTPGLEIVDAAYYSRVRQHNDALRRKGYRNEQAHLTPTVVPPSRAAGRTGTLYVDSPEPLLFRVNMADLRTNGDWAGNVARLVVELKQLDATRVVLDVVDSDLKPTTVSGSPEEFRGGPPDLVAWADDSVSSWIPGNTSAPGAKSMPPISKYTYVPLRFSGGGDWRKHSRPVDEILCNQFMRPTLGNRSCFSICK